MYLHDGALGRKARRQPAHARFGYGCCAFINGDERLPDLQRADGSRGLKSWSRDAASEAFNGGDVRFLVSTEAAGEGIDLQERCATLVHVDMPWNPSPPKIDSAQLKDLQSELIAAMATSLDEIADMMTRPALRSEIFLLPDHAGA